MNGTSWSSATPSARRPPCSARGLKRSILVGTGNAVGMAEHALEVFLESIAKKTIAYSPYNRQEDAPVTHLNVEDVTRRICGVQCKVTSANVLNGKADALPPPLRQL